MTIEIRPEQAGDEAAIYQVTKDAFTGPPYAAGDEQDLVNRLRELNQLSLSLVAVDGDNIVGRLELPRDRAEFIADFEKKYAKLRLRVSVMHVPGASEQDRSAETGD